VETSQHVQGRGRKYVTLSRGLAQQAHLHEEHHHLQEGQRGALHAANSASRSSSGSTCPTTSTGGIGPTTTRMSVMGLEKAAQGARSRSPKQS